MPPGLTGLRCPAKPLLITPEICRSFSPWTYTLQPHYAGYSESFEISSRYSTQIIHSIRLDLVFMPRKEKLERGTTSAEPLTQQQRGADTRAAAAEMNSAFSAAGNEGRAITRAEKAAAEATQAATSAAAALRFMVEPSPCRGSSGCP